MKKPVNQIIYRVAGVVCLTMAIVALPAVSHAQPKYRFVGGDGNRAIAVIGKPGDPNVVLVGAASGGIWRTEDRGLSWQPVFDKYEVQSVGSLAMAPSAPNIIWAGTGETFLMRPAHAMGNGIYRSDDMGLTWQLMGLEKTGRIGRVVIHPRNPDIVFAAPWGIATDRRKSAVFSAPWTAARRGNRCFLWTRIPAVPTWPWIRSTRRRSLRGCGKWISKRGG